jgi:hypothetical protein
MFANTFGVLIFMATFLAAMAVWFLGYLGFEQWWPTLWFVLLGGIALGTWILRKGTTSSGDQQDLSE